MSCFCSVHSRAQTSWPFRKRQTFEGTTFERDRLERDRKYDLSILFGLFRICIVGQLAYVLSHSNNQLLAFMVQNMILWASFITDSVDNFHEICIHLRMNNRMIYRHKLHIVGCNLLVYYSDGISLGLSRSASFNAGRSSITTRIMSQSQGNTQLILVGSSSKA